jgi:putative inorganic carbon (hco3(-)) transporter
MSFVLFVVLNAILLIRPEELQPEIAGLRLYLIVITLSSVTALPNIVELLRPDKLAKRPLNLLVLGLLFATAASQMAHGQVDKALDFASEFGKVVIYYLLLVAVVNTPGRLRWFLAFLVIFIVILAVLGLLQYHGVIDHAALKPVEQKEYDSETGQILSYPRLCSAGIFNDPNDLCLILTFGIICCLYHAATARSIWTALISILPIGLFGYAMMLTKSRGGLLGLMSAITAYLVAKLGWRRALPMVLIGAPMGLFILGGRQANINLDSADTAYARVMLWGEGLTELYRSPRSWLTGIGAGQYVQEAGLAAHNSFVQGYVELGLLGGTCFFVAFVDATRMLYRLSVSDRRRLRPALVDSPPFLLAIVVGYCGGMYSLSRNYVIPTYLCLGVAEAYLAMATPNPIKEFRLSDVWAKQTALLGVGGLVFLKLSTQVIGQLWT